MASLKDLGNSLQGFFSNAGKAVSSALPQVGQAVWNATPIGQVQQLQKNLPQIQNFFQKYPSPASYIGPNIIQPAINQMKINNERSLTPVQKAMSSIQNNPTLQNEARNIGDGLKSVWDLGPGMAPKMLQVPFASDPQAAYRQAVQDIPGNAMRGVGLAFKTAMPLVQYGYQLGMAPIKGALQAHRTGESFGQATEKAVINQPGLGTAAFGEGPMATVGNVGEFLAPFGINAGKTGIKNFNAQRTIGNVLKEGEAMGFAGLSPRAFQIHPEDQKILTDIIGKSQSGIKPNAEELKTLDVLAQHYLGQKYEVGSTDKIMKTFDWVLAKKNGGLPIGNLPKPAYLNSNNVEDIQNIQTVFHGTNKQNAESIRNNGFNSSFGKGGMSGQSFSDFTFVTPSKSSAQFYANNNTNAVKFGGSDVVESKLNGKLLEISGQTRDMEAIGKAGEKFGIPLGEKGMLNIPAIKKALKDNGYIGVSFKDRNAGGRIAYAIADNNNLNIVNNTNSQSSGLSMGIVGKNNTFQEPLTKLPQSESLQPLAKLPQVGEMAPLAPTQQPRGFTTSIKESKNVISPVQEQVNAAYTPKPNTQLMGEAQALLQSGAKIDFKNVKNIDQKITATIQEAINQQSTNPELAANLFNNLSEQGTELGRGVQAFSLLNKMSPEAIALSAAGKIKKYNQTATRKIPELTGDQVALIGQKVDTIKKLADGSREKNIAINELSNTINKFIPSSIVDKALTVWKAGLLTSFRTTERNILSNTVHGAMEIAKDVPASVADIIMSAKTGKRTIIPTIQGSGEFLSKNTAQQISDVLRLGYDASEDITKFDHKAINWGNNPLEQVLKKYTDIVFRSLGAQDKPFYNAAFKRSLYSQAGAEALNAGQKGSRSFIQNLVENPTEEMLKIAVNDANVATFKNKNVASNISSTIKRELSKTELGKLASEITMPFTGVPSSVLGQISSYSPIGLLKGIANTGKVLVQDVPELQRQAAQEIGRGVIGTGIFGLGSYLASKGLITGQPKDATEQRQWDLENKPRNSIMIGGKWRSLNSIGPEAVVALAGAKLNEEMKSPEGSLGGYAGTLAKDYLDQSFVTGLQQPVNVITDPNRYGKAYVGNQLASIVPNIVKDTSKSIDSLQRETNTVQDYFKQSIPGLRNTLTEKRDVLGNTMKQEPTGAGAIFDLFNSKTPVNNQAIQELSRLNLVGENATPGKAVATQNLGGVKTKLTPDQLNEFEKNVGPKITQALSDLFSTQYYKSLSDVDKSKLVDSTVAKVRKEYRDSFGTDGQKTSAKTIKIKSAPKMKKVSVKKPTVKSVKVPKMKKTKITNFKVAKPKKIKVTKSKPITYRSIMSHA